MRKESYRIIFEGAFDNALYNAITFNSCARLSNDRLLIGATQHVLLFRMLNMAYEMDIVNWDEKQYLKSALEAIFED